MEQVTSEKNLLSTQIRKHTKTNEEIEREIREFLNEAASKPGFTDKLGCPLKHGLACVLATVYNGVPRATPIDFFVDGLTIWCAGEPGLKIRNIRSNPKVAVGIYHPMDHSKLNRSLQISGTATLLAYSDDPNAFIERLKIMGIYDAAAKIVKEMYETRGKQPENFEQELINHLRRFNIIKIEPEEITMLRIHPTGGTEKNTWKRPPAA